MKRLVKIGTVPAGYVAACLAASGAYDLAVLRKQGDPLAYASGGLSGVSKAVLLLISRQCTRTRPQINKRRLF